MTVVDAAVAVTGKSAAAWTPGLGGRRGTTEALAQLRVYERAVTAKKRADTD
jgi:hypothetical protein